MLFLQYKFEQSGYQSTKTYQSRPKLIQFEQRWPRSFEAVQSPPISNRLRQN